MSNVGKTGRTPRKKRVSAPPFKKTGKLARKDVEQAKGPTKKRTRRATAPPFKGKGKLLEKGVERATESTDREITRVEFLLKKLQSPTVTRATINEAKNVISASDNIMMILAIQGAKTNEEFDEKIKDKDKRIKGCDDGTEKIPNDVKERYGEETANEWKWELQEGKRQLLVEREASDYTTTTTYSNISGSVVSLEKAIETAETFLKEGERIEKKLVKKKPAKRLPKIASVDDLSDRNKMKAAKKQLEGLKKQYKEAKKVSDNISKEIATSQKYLNKLEGKGALERGTQVGLEAQISALEKEIVALNDQRNETLRTYVLLNTNIKSAEALREAKMDLGVTSITAKNVAEVVDHYEKAVNAFLKADKELRLAKAKGEYVNEKEQVLKSKKEVVGKALKELRVSLEEVFEEYDFNKIQKEVAKLEGKIEEQESKWFAFFRADKTKLAAYNKKMKEFKNIERITTWLGGVVGESEGKSFEELNKSLEKVVKEIGKLSTSSIFAQKAIRDVKNATRVKEGEYVLPTRKENKNLESVMKSLNKFHSIRTKRAVVTGLEEYKEATREATSIAGKVALIGMLLAPLTMGFTAVFGLLNFMATITIGMLREMGADAAIELFEKGTEDLNETEIEL